MVTGYSPCLTPRSISTFSVPKYRYMQNILIFPHCRQFLSIWSRLYTLFAKHNMTLPFFSIHPLLNMLACLWCIVLCCHTTVFSVCSFLTLALYKQFILSGIINIIQIPSLHWESNLGPAA